METTKAQCKEVLERLRDFAYHNYYTKEAGERFNGEQKNRPLEHEGRKFYISIEESGLIKINLLDSEEFALISCDFHMVAPMSESGLDNCAMNIEIVNKENLSPKNLDFFESVKIFCGSLFQRTVVMTFLARMQEPTINAYSCALAVE